MPYIQNRVYRFLCYLLLCFSLLLDTGCTSPSTATSVPKPDAPPLDELDKQLNEKIIRVRVDPEYPTSLVVTTFKPSGPGPFPLAVINHGKNPGDAYIQPRARSIYLARYFVSRGYEVVLPMLRGFAGSDGTIPFMKCDAQSEGLLQAYDIRTVIHYMAQQPDIDASRIIIAGQSYGGWNSLALGTLDIPGVRGLLNFAGGRRDPDCRDFSSDLTTTAAYYGHRTHIPSLWFYGENDTEFSVATWQGMYQQYTANGGQAELVNVGHFMEDSHQFLGKIEAIAVWMPKVDALLERIGLPNKNLHPELLPAPYPPPTHFAALDDINAIPYLRDSGRQQYKKFLAGKMPKVFVIAHDGTSVASHGGYDPLEHALELCRKAGHVCYPYAIDDDVVWPPSASATQ